jgi:hypothetical protein
LRPSFLVLALVLGAGALQAEAVPSAPLEVVQVPIGRPALTDGRCPSQEWGDAREVALSDSVKLLVKQSGEFVFACLSFTRPAMSSLDLYLEPAGGGLHNLHASAKLGERMLQNGGSGPAWPEWTWWNHQGWTANVMRFDRANPTTFLPDEAKELQIRRDLFPASTWRVRIEVQGDLAVAFPPGTTSLKSDGWLVLALDRP